MSLWETAGWPVVSEDPPVITDTDIDWPAEIARDDREIEDELAEYVALMEFAYGDRHRAARWMRGERDE